MTGIDAGFLYMETPSTHMHTLKIAVLDPPAGAIDLDAIISPDAPPHARAELAQVFALLRTLPANERIAWSLRYVEGFDLRQTAALCDCSLATVKRRIQRAQNHIKGHFVDPRESRSEEEATTAPKTPSANNDEEAAS